MTSCAVPFFFLLVHNFFKDWMAGRSKRAKDELAYLLQNRRKILVDMAFRLAMDGKMVGVLPLN